MSDETPFWERDPAILCRELGLGYGEVQLMQAEREREHLRKRLNGMREDLDEALDWVEAGESVLIPMLRMHGVETTPLVHFDMLVSEVHRTGLIERLDHERWRPVDGEEVPEDGQMVRAWSGIAHGEGRLIWRNGTWAGAILATDEITHWRPKAKGPGGEDE